MNLGLSARWATLSAALFSAGVWAQSADSVIPLSTINGQSGLRIDGSGPGNQFSASLEANGDFNGDGIADLVVGAPNAPVTRGGQTGVGAGEVFVLFGGRAGIEHGFELDRLRVDSGGDGSLGYVLQGEFYAGEFIPDRAGSSVANAGDINGDGIDDLLVGAIGRGTGFGEGFSNPPQGAAYLIFGRPDDDPMPAEFDLGRLLPTGTDNENSGFGVILHGSQIGGQVGFAVAGIGDVNGDGRDDLMVGNGLPFLVTIFNGGSQLSSVQAASYVVFGRAEASPWPAELRLSELLSGGGIQGFAILGESATSLGSAVAGIGDFTGDGRDDILLGTFSLFRTTFDPFDPGGRHGGAVIIPGRGGAGVAEFGAVLDLEDFNAGPAVHQLLGPLVDFVQVGKAVAGIGDINGDGRPDIAIAGLYEPADIPGQSVPRPPEADYVYVLYGRSASNPLPQSFELADLINGNGRTGFVITGPPNENLGSAVSNLGDVNGDGRSDLLLGASGKGGNARGGAYVVFGRASDDPFPALFTVGGQGRGFSLDGEQDSDQAGFAVTAAGDLNGDGSTDFVLGARLGDGGGNNAGSAYVIFGAGNDVEALRIDGTLSRAWYDPNRAGEGIMTDFGTLNGEPALFAAWYTYLEGEQQWFAVETQTFEPGATTFELPLIRTDGGQFGSAFDPDLIEFSTWGSVRVTVEDCDRLSWDYASSDGSQTGSLDFIPALPDLLGLPGCRESVTAKGLESPLGPAVSGTWWNASRSGEGIILDIESRGEEPTAFVSWFTYAAGVQRWLVGSGPVEAGATALTDIPMVVTEGGEFGPAFDPAQVIDQEWGSASIRFTGCTTATLDYDGQFPGQGGESGSIELVRFNGDALDLDCID